MNEAEKTIRSTHWRTLLPQQRRYADIGRLIDAAISIQERAEKRLDRPSWAEDLKRWAAERGICYDSDSISKALDIAELRMSERLKR